MKTATTHLTFETPNRRELIRITEDLHITPGIWVNDDEPGLHEDTIEWLDKGAPPRGAPKRVVIKAMGE